MVLGLRLCPILWVVCAFVLSFCLGEVVGVLWHRAAMSLFVFFVLGACPVVSAQAFFI